MPPTHIQHSCAVRTLSQCDPGGRLTVAVAPELVNASADLGSLLPSTSTMGPMPRPPLGQASCIVTGTRASAPATSSPSLGEITSDVQPQANAAMNTGKIQRIHIFLLPRWPQIAAGLTRTD